MCSSDLAMPLIASVYVGVAEAALEIARAQGKHRQQDHLFHIQLGDAINEVNTARVALESMVRLVNNFDYPGTKEFLSEILSRKTIASRAVIDGARKSLEAVGGSAYYRSLGLERLVRDALAAQFHPFADLKQQEFSGRVAIGLEPPSEPFNPEE